MHAVSRSAAGRDSSLSSHKLAADGTLGLDERCGRGHLAREHSIDEINAEASKALSQGHAAKILNAMVSLSDKHPEQVLTAYHAALSLSWSGRYAESLPYFDRAIAADRNFFYAHANKGAALEQLGRGDDACRAFRIAYDLDSKLGRELETKLKSCKGQ
jgi:tetratricopeptide (TPR) repeat protein